MKRILFICILSLFALDMQGQVSLLPQVGLNLTRYNTDPLPFTQRARLGLHFGGSLRFGDKVFFQPGVLFLRQKVEFEEIEFPLPPIPNTDQINLNSIDVAGLFGFHLIHTDVFRMRLSAGPTATFVTAVSPNKLNLTKENYNSSRFGARAGLGFDVLIFTLDINYDHALSDAFSDRESKVRMLSASAGIRVTFN